MPSLTIAVRTLARAFSVTRMPLAGACAGCVVSVAVVIKILRVPSAAKAAIDFAPLTARLEAVPLQSNVSFKTALFQNNALSKQRSVKAAVFQNNAPSKQRWG